MKNLILSLALAVTLIGGTVVLNYAYPSSNSDEKIVVDDLSDDNGVLRDMVFDKNGNLVSETTYKWNTTTDTKGDVVSRTIYACN